MADSNSNNPVNPGEPNPANPPQPNPVPADNNEPKPVNDQDWYWHRQTEKERAEKSKIQEELDVLAKKLKAREDAELSELEKRDRELTETKSSMDNLNKKLARLEAIHDAQLPSELANLVPEGIDNPKDYIEKNLIPLRDKLSTPASFGNPTSPTSNSTPNDDQLVLGEYRQMQKSGASQTELLAFYSKNRKVLSRLLSTSS